jgi:hypothetical protein
MPLLAPIHFAPIFAPLVGRQVCYIPAGQHIGNTGDRLLALAACQLLVHFGIECVDDPVRADALLLFGGGNFGHPACQPEAEQRLEAVRTGKPCYVLPVTCYGPESGGFERVYARDHVSLATLERMGVRSSLVPDLALGYMHHRPIPSATRERGVFLTTSPEGKFGSLTIGNLGDPRMQFLADPPSYIEFAAGFDHIVTDIMHLCICGLIAGRRVTLLPTRLHKQRSTWETWLRWLGCEWAEAPEDA